MTFRGHALMSQQRCGGSTQATGLEKSLCNVGKGTPTGGLTDKPSLSLLAVLFPPSLATFVGSPSQTSKSDAQ